jgi:glycogen debranching enzyme
MSARTRGETPHPPIAPADRGLTAEKQRILTHGTPSVTKGISDAIVIKAENVFFLSNDEGSVPLAPGHGLGLFYHDCRFLRGYELRLAGQEPTVLAQSADGGTSVFQLANPDLRLGRDRLIPRETVDIRWTRVLHAGTPALHDTLAFRNLGLERITLPISFAFDAQFEDLFAVRGLFRERLGHVRRPTWHGRTLRLSYDGKDRCRRSVRIVFSRMPTRARQSASSASFAIALPPRRDVTLRIALTLGEHFIQPNGRDRRANGRHLRATAPARDLAREPRTSVTTDSMLLNAVLARSFADLTLLRSPIDGKEYFAAGVPWFATLFGRDAAITAIEMLAYEPRIAEQTARLLAFYQAHQMSEWRDEQPGKILHSIRVGEMARLHLIPHTPYYGSVDATPLFLILVGRHAAWTGDLTLFHELLPNIELALGWMADGADSDDDGYIDYASTSAHGLINQGWKDSGDAIVTARGRLATPPIALVEVQGYTYLARALMADLYERAGDATRAALLRAQARDLRARFERDFWIASLGCYALALEAGQRPLSVITSNAGQALWTGIVTSPRARRVASRLMAPDMFSGWGIRTLSTKARRYNPVAYHLGTVWPHDNALIATGFRRYGLDREARRVFAGLVRAAAHFPSFRLPEVFAGFSTDEFTTPVRYPVACHPQAWASGSVPYLLIGLLGLEPDAFAGHLRVVRPVLPDGVSRLELHDLPVGRARISLGFRRTTNGRVEVEPLSTHGRIELIIEASRGA